MVKKLFSEGPFSDSEQLANTVCINHKSDAFHGELAEMLCNYAGPEIYWDFIIQIFIATL
jgi:hypothetical protein